MAGFGGMYNSFRVKNSVSDSITARDIARNKTQAGKAQRYVIALEERIDKLLLVNMAVWELLKERTSLTEEDLQAKVHEIDMRDGVADGKVTQKIMKCPKCDRTMSPKHRKCLYCGAKELQNEAYDNAK